jgi:ureidoacrylate peracid hydrolase
LLFAIWTGENAVAYTIRPTLTIIDIQNGFVSDRGSFYKFGYDISSYQKIIPVIQDIYRKVKSLKIPVFFSQALREKSGIDMLDKYHRILPRKRRERIRKLPLCVRGTWDSEFVDGLKPAEDDLVVHKRRDSIFQDTEFELWLRSLGVDTIIFTGIDTSICVESSLRDAFNRGWDVILISDATASLNAQFYQTTISETMENFGLVLNSQELFDNLRQTGDNEFSLEIELT